ncbi:TniQ family protein [Synechocystis sp. FACHB-383]|nr:TniQ family protein [Synechocystis sp. FACHB-383]
MSTEMELKPWLFRVEPLPGESLSHFLGRVRQRNHISASELGTLAGIGAVVSRWEKFRHNPFPSAEELGALGDLLGIDGAILRAMLPPLGESLKMEPIRLCGACYEESPYHRLEWQLQSTWRTISFCSAREERGIAQFCNTWVSILRIPWVASFLANKICFAINLIVKANSERFRSQH